ncbi:MAG: L,D-transpeptidase [Candidatus Doudnabacteria bacterium]|nr:L,D-transpeptidase [Candidatus Doudnabacteria bacterium]
MAYFVQEVMEHIFKFNINIHGSDQLVLWRSQKTLFENFSAKSNARLFCDRKKDAHAKFSGMNLLFLALFGVAFAFFPGTLDSGWRNDQTWASPGSRLPRGFPDAPALSFGQLPVVPAPAERYVLVDLQAQRLRVFENEELVMEAIISSGHEKRPTPKGSFAIQNKSPRAFSKVAKLYMPYWMAFTHDGQYYLGFHELPEYPDGSKEGEEHLGRPYSGGCIRLGEGAAERLYSWAKVGDKVLIY